MKRRLQANCKAFFSTIHFILLITLFLAFSKNCLAANEAMVVYTKIKGAYAEQDAEFRAIVKKSLDELLAFEVVQGIKGTVTTDKPLPDKLAAAKFDNIPLVAEVTLDTEKKKADLKLQIYRNDGENTFNWVETFKINNIKSFLAQLEYQMPLKLKSHYHELGKVIKKDKRLIYFDLGESAGVKPGEYFRVYEEGDAIEDDDGNSYGNLEVTTGIVRVTAVTAVYSIAEIIIGELAIDTKQWIKRTKEDEQASFDGKILAVLENQVAISIGKNVGVEEGSYYAVYRDIKPINDKEAFRHPVGHIKINEVFDNFSKGELSISDTFDITKYTISTGDKVEEVESPRKNTWGINQTMTNVNSETSGRILHFSYQRDSLINVNMVYRFKAGMGTGRDIFAAAGVMHSMGHSAHVFAGIDLMYIGDSAINLFIAVDVDTPVSRNLKINLESGFILAHSDDRFNGLNTTIGIKYAYNLF